jgi:anti-sigma regulatory factor (Ser/Thr protein kinase)
VAARSASRIQTEVVRELLRSGVASPLGGYKIGVRSAVKTLTLTLAALPDSVPQARRALQDFAIEAGASADQVDAVRLASSEAVTNAVLHAYGDDPGKVYITAALVSDELWILIADDGCGLEPQTGRPGLGLGLGLIAQASDHLTIVPRAGGGTEVHIRFDLDEPRSSGFRRVPTRSRASTSRGGTAWRDGSFA